MSRPSYIAQVLTLRCPILLVFAATALGAAVSDLTDLSPAAAALFLSLTVALLLVSVRRTVGVLVVSLITFAGAGALRATFDRGRALEPIHAPCGLDESLWQLRITGPTSRSFSARDGRLQRSTKAELISQRCDEHWLPATGSVTLRLGAGLAIARGDVLQLHAEVEPVTTRRNPTEPDPAALARRDGVAGRAFARGDYVFTAHGGALLGAIDRARDIVAQRFEANFPPPEAAVAKALSLGDQGAVTFNQREAWADTGIAHILSVSGLHVTLIATLIFALLRKLISLSVLLAERWSARRIAASLALPAVVAFCLWVGAPAAAVRATVMACACLAGMIFLRPNAVLNSLGLAGTGILLVSPASLYDPGFLLSFVAVLALLLAPNPAPTAAAASGGWGRARRAVAAAVLASVVATLATAPISAYFFGRVSLLAPFSNLIAVPLGSVVATPLALVFGALAWAFSAASVPPVSMLFDLVRYPLHAALAALEWIAYTGARVPAAAVNVPRPTMVELVAYAVLAVALLRFGLARRWPLSTRASRHAWMALVMAGGLVLGGSAAWRVWSVGHRNELRLIHPYVGQGDATLVLLPRGGVMLVDAGGPLEKGGFDPGARVLLPLLRQLGIGTIDVAVVTHPHPDHLEGFAALARHIDIRELWWNGEGADLATMRALVSKVREGGGRVLARSDLLTLSEREGITIEVFAPSASRAGDRETVGGNNGSLVLRLRYGERTVLLAGDIEASAELSMVERLAPGALRSDILKVPHHGSRTSSTDTFLDAVNPNLAIFSVGYRNRFNFPHADVLERYVRRRIQIVSTEADGCIDASTDGVRWIIRGERGRGLELPP